MKRDAVYWEQNPVVYNDEDNEPMRDDGRLPYRLKTWQEIQEEQKNGGSENRIPGAK